MLNTLFTENGLDSLPNVLATSVGPEYAQLLLGLGLCPGQELLQRNLKLVFSPEIVHYRMMRVVIYKSGGVVGAL